MIRWVAKSVTVIVSTTFTSTLLSGSPTVEIS
jgi:hypothetical protein